MTTSIPKTVPLDHHDSNIPCTNNHSFLTSFHQNSCNFQQRPLSRSLHAQSPTFYHTSLSHYEHHATFLTSHHWADNHKQHTPLRKRQTSNKSTTFDTTTPLLFLSTPRAQRRAQSVPLAPHHIYYMLD